MGALFTNTTGSNNIAIGLNAGYNPTAGSNNIEIGNYWCRRRHQHDPHRTQGTQTKTFIAGIAGSRVYRAATSL